MSQRSGGAVYDTLPAVVPGVFPGFGEDAPLDLGPLSDRAEQQMRDLLISGKEFDAFSEELARVGNCSRPIRLVGESARFDATTGEELSRYSSAQEPLGATFIRCGNRRASVCPSCARLYAGDVFQLIRAGVCGGKAVPETIAENPMVFATFTAPSFGHVHGRRDTGPCRGTGSRVSKVCRHGRPTSCPAHHSEDDPLLGQPLCGDCYDYASQVVWQWWAPDLWRRFTITLRRQVAKALGVPATKVDRQATVQYAKVSEDQRRGVVHFHALIRLDGPKTHDGFAPAPSGLDVAGLARLVRRTARAVRLTVPGVDGDDPVRVLALGRQVDAKPVARGRRTDDPDRNLTPGQVAGYVAKYATKSITDITATDNPHFARLRATTAALAARADAAPPQSPAGKPEPYELLGKRVHSLGFRGHFASKSRRYSITLRALRRARRRAQILIAQHRAEDRPIDLAALEADLLAEEEDETTVVISSWRYAGSGWANDAQTLLANAAAARAREHEQWKAQQRRNQSRTTNSGR